MESLPQQCERLRRLVNSCISSHELASAVFFADKLACLSRAPQDVLLLAQVLDAH
jgi:hypothetical protein